MHGLDNVLRSPHTQVCADAVLHIRHIYEYWRQFVPEEAEREGTCSFLLSIHSPNGKGEDLNAFGACCGVMLETVPSSPSWNHI